MAELQLWRDQELRRIREEMRRMFDELCTEFGLPAVSRPLGDAGGVEVSEDAEEVLVRMSLPGLDPSRLDVTLTEETLTIACKRRREFNSGEEAEFFETHFSLPCKVRTEDVQAEYSDGTLEIRLPKCKRPRVRSIRVESR